MLHDIAAALGSTLVSSTVLTGGFSHETRLLTLTDGRVVARFGGADPAIEAAIMAVARAHVPVPEVLLVTPEVMVIEYVDGVVLSTVLDTMRDGGPTGAGDNVRDDGWERLLTAALDGGRDGVRALGAEVGRTVAEVAAVRFDRPGFFAGADLAVTAEPPWSGQLAAVAEECMAKVPADRLDTAIRRAWVRLCAAHAPALEAVDDHARLVHSDVNPKNILVTRAGGDWRVAALLDWEFSYAGCPYADAGNMARFAGDHPAGFLDGFRAGFADRQPAGLPLIEDWAYLGAVLDMFALSDLVTRPPGHAVADRAAARIRASVRTGTPEPRI